LSLLLESPAIDLLAGIDRFIDDALGMRHRTRSAALSFGRSAQQLDGPRFVTGLLALLEANWNLALSRNPRASAQNFRWHAPVPAISGHNTSPEVTLERALIRALNAAGRTDWSNQVPLVSGITGNWAGKRRAVDLVHEKADGGFEFVELKVDSDTPLSAGLEVLQYGMLWLLSRRDSHVLGYASPIIAASSLDLTVLAPRSYYERYALQPFATALDQGVRHLGNTHGVRMSFALTVFSRDFEWRSPYTGDHYTSAELVGHLDRREPV
jgi:hypothetical protein